MMQRLFAAWRGRPERLTVRGGSGAGSPPPEVVLLRVLCHELRAPVASLGSLTRVLSDPAAPVPPPVRAEIADLAHRQAVHLEALLAQARTAVGVTDHRPSGPGVVPLGHALSAARAVVAPERLSVSVTARAARRPVQVPMVQQVLTNLLENAARHSPSGSPVRLSARTRGPALLLSVCNDSDHGDDVAAALHSSSVPDAVSGLGLSIVAELVAGVDGTVRARQRGRRVVVDVVLPGVPRA